MGQILGMNQEEYEALQEPSGRKTQQDWEAEYESMHWSDLPIAKAALLAVIERVQETLMEPHKRRQKP